MTHGNESYAFIYKLVCENSVEIPQHPAET